MTNLTKILAGGAGLAAMTGGAPAAAQYAYPYAYGNATQLAAQRCAAAVQSRLSNRTSILGVVFGANTGRVLSVTQANPRRNVVRVRGLASSGRTSYGPYGVGLYGGLGYSYAPDLTFRCDVDYRGYVRDIDIDRR